MTILPPFRRGPRRIAPSDGRQLRDSCAMCETALRSLRRETSWIVRKSAQGDGGTSTANKSNNRANHTEPDQAGNRVRNDQAGEPIEQEQRAAQYREGRPAERERAEDAITTKIGGDFPKLLLNRCRGHGCYLFLYTWTAQRANVPTAVTEAGEP